MAHFLVLLVLGGFLGSSRLALERPKVLIAHRGASAYAPENTAAAYRLALDQEADFVEQDLQITRDGVLVCLHDETLERTTDVEERYPDRFREVEEQGAVKRRWFVSDFTLEEIRRLDAGSWFDSRFAGERVPTFREAIELVRGKAGLYPETKSPESYARLGFSMEQLLIEDLRRYGLDEPGADPASPVIVQSFSHESLKRLKEAGLKLPLVFLISEGMRSTWTTDGALERIGEFVAGIGPSKTILIGDPGLVGRARSKGLTVTPYTFRSASVLEGFADVEAEMRYFLYQLGVDALFTDNPDRFPRNR